MGHTITVGLPMLRVQRRNPLDSSEPPRARDEVTHGVATSWHIHSPIEGTWCLQGVICESQLGHVPLHRIRQRLMPPHR
jgi:hypothetical protein